MENLSQDMVKFKNELMTKEDMVVFKRDIQESVTREIEHHIQKDTSGNCCRNIS